MSPRPTSGELLRQTFGIYFANFVPFTLIVVVVLFIPLGAQGVLVMQGEITPTSFSGIEALLALLSFVLTPVATGALTYGVFQTLRRRPVGISDCLSTGLNRLFPVLVVGLVAGLLTALGVVLCIIPGFIVATMVAAAVPAAVIEKPGITGAINRSAELTKGHRWTVFGVLFSLILLGFLAGLALATIQTVSVALWYLGNVALNLVSTGLQATAGSVIYYNLRRTKETFDVEEIAAVFE